MAAQSLSELVWSDQCDCSQPAGVMGACTLTYMLSGAILQRALAELILIEGVKPL